MRPPHQSRLHRKGAIPRMDASEDEILEFHRLTFNEDAKYRRTQMIRMALNLWMYKGRHWMIESDARSTANGYVWRELVRPSGASFPQPVDNWISSSVDNEVARLGRQVYEPKIRASRPMPDLERAASVAQAVLRSDLQEMEWERIREACLFDLCTYGTTVARSVWDEAVTDIVTVANPEAVICSTCNERYASSRIPRTSLEYGIPGKGPGGGPLPMQWAETIEDSDDPDTVGMTHCPTCAIPSPLKPVDVGPEETGLVDMFGRPLGLDVPRGAGLITCESPFSIYPENGGVDIEPDTCNVWGRRSIESLDWIDSHLPPNEACPDWDPQQVGPGDPHTLLKSHPLMGDRALMGSSFDAENTYPHHQVVDELVVRPLPRLTGLAEGRWIQIVDGKIARNEVLTQTVEVEHEHEPVSVERVTYAAARYKRVPREFFGRTPIDDIRPLQRRLNELDAQMVDIRERGKPFMAVPRGTEVDTSTDQAGSLNLVEVDSIDPNWSAQSAIVNAQPLTGNQYLQEREKIEASIQRLMGPSAFEQGVNPTGVTSGDQLQILAEQKAAERGPRERRLVEMTERLMSAHLEKTWAFRREEASYEARGEANQYDRQMYVGTDLAHQTNVKLELGGKFDRSLFQDKGVEWAVQNQLFDMTDPVGRARVLQLRGLPDVNDGKSIQVDRAEQAWSQFVREGKVPVVDEDLDDPWIRFQVLGKRWYSDEGVQIQLSAGWDRILQLISGKWEKTLLQAELLDGQQRKFYEGIPPEQWGAVYEQGSALAKESADLAAKAAETAALAGQPAQPQAPLPTVPKPPESGSFLPDAMQDRIEFVMQKLAAPAMVQLPPVGMSPDGTAMPPMLSPEDEQRLATQQRCIAFYATIHAYRLIDERHKAEAKMGAQVAAAPGGGRTPDGMVPQAGAPVMPAPGMPVGM